MLFSGVMIMGTNGIFCSLFNKANEGKKGVVSFYNVVVPLFALIVWGIIALFDFEYNENAVRYGLIYGFCYFVTQIGTVMAMRTGKVSITSLIMQFSLIGVTVWGFVFWGDKPRLVTAIGLCFVVLSLVLCLKKDEADGDKKVSLKWILFCLIMFCGNAGCAIAQKSYVLKTDGNGRTMLMLVGIGVAFVMAFLTYLPELKYTKPLLNKYTVYPVAVGSLNAVHNLFMMLLISVYAFPTQVQYPVVCVGATIVSVLLSVVWLKEKIGKRQWIGVALGTVAILLMNL